MIKLGLVGCAHIHTPGFVRMINARNDVDVSKVWDHDSARALKNAAALGAVVSSDLDDIWNDETIPAVVICSETNRHTELVMAATAAGKHQFVEKPLAGNATNASRMAVALKDAGVLFQTGYFMRGFPEFRFAKEAIASGHLGKVTRIRLSNGHKGALEDWFTPEWLWMTEPEMAGVGAFGDLGTHILDILLWLTEASLTRVTCSVGTALNRYGESCEEYGEAILRFEDGMLATIAAGWVDITDPIKLQISGTEGHIHVIDKELFFQSQHVEGADGKTGWTNLPEPLPHAFELFLDAVAGCQPPAGLQSIPLVSPTEAAYRTKIMAALYEAGAKDNEHWVTITT